MVGVYACAADVDRPLLDPSRRLMVVPRGDRLYPGCSGRASGVAPRVWYRVYTPWFTSYAGLFEVGGVTVYAWSEPLLDPEEERLVEELVEESLYGGGLPEAVERLGVRDERVVAHARVRLEGFHPVDVPMRDPHVEDVLVRPGWGRSRVYHRLAGGWVEALVDVSTVEARRLMARVGATPTLSSPVAEGGDAYARVAAVDYRTPEPVLVIRRHLARPSLDELAGVVAPREVLENLRLRLVTRGAVIIIGPTGAGKTTLFNALLDSLPRSWSIVTVEEVPELRLRHPGWVPLYARDEEDMVRLLRGALRMRPDALAVGEARGVEARLLVQYLATGHAGGSTFHASSLRELVYRLTAPPVSLGPSYLYVIDAVAVLANRGGERRLVALYEVDPGCSSADEVVEVGGWRLCARLVWREGAPPGDVHEKSLRLRERAALYGVKRLQ